MTDIKSYTTFYVGHNMPGYLPDGDTPDEGFDNFEDARACLLADMEFYGGGIDEDYGAFEDAMDEVSTWTGPNSVISGGYAWWVMAE